MIYPPSPKGSFILGHAAGFRKEPLEFMLKALADHGDVVMFRILKKKVYLINHPDLIKYVLQENHKNFTKSPGYKPLRLLVGNGLFTSEGDLWLQQRRMIQPAFSRENISNYANEVQTCTLDLVDKWKHICEHEEELNISREMMKVTLEIIGKTMFGKGLGDKADHVWQAITDGLEYVNHRALNSPFVAPDNWPTPSNRRFKKSVALLDEVIERLINEAEDKNDTSTMLGKLLHHIDDGTGEKMSKQQVRDEVMTMFLAGHESSANVLTWTLYLLSQHPDVLLKLQEEINEICGDKLPDYEKVRKMKYAIQVLNEVMRLYPPVWHLGRMNIDKDALGDYPIPVGTHIRISPYAIHRHPDYWENPDAFDPERFDESKNKIHPFSFIPFGAGPRLCIGKGFALMEMTILLVGILQNFNLSYKRSKKVEKGTAVTLRTKEDLFMNVELNC